MITRCYSRVSNDVWRVLGSEREHPKLLHWVAKLVREESAYEFKV